MNEPQRASRSGGRALTLFLFFFKVGFYTFGGGWSIVAQIQKEYVERQKWITEEDLLDITSVGRSLPGLMIGNVSYLFGYHVAGFPGAILSVIGISLPSLIVLTVVTWCYTMFKDHIYVSRAMAGVRATVVPIILVAALKLSRAALPEKISWAFLALGLALYLFLGVSCIWIMVISGLLGLLLRTLQQRRKGGSHGTS